jgi:hypothetical protein
MRKVENREIVSELDALDRIDAIFDQFGGEVCAYKPTEKKKLPSIIRKLRQSSLSIKSFLVADIERILNEQKQHVPYAIGIMAVEPGSDLPSKDSISWWYSFDLFMGESFVVRSKMMMDAFLAHLESMVTKKK